MSEQKTKISLSKRQIVILALFFTFYLSIAYYLVFDLQLVFRDAVSRTEKAFLVFFDNSAKISSIGFIWTPLPSILQLPLVIFKPLAKYGFSGNIISALFGALSCLYIYKFLNKSHLNFFSKIIFLLLFGLNPMIILYSANGMSEIIFVFFIILASWHLIKWNKTKRMTELILLGIILSLAFFTRYETIPLAITIGFLVIFLNYGKIKTRFNEIQGSIVLYFLPILFSVFLWIVANWLIMGDPFYFLRGEYSNIEQSNFIGGELKKLKGNLVDAIYYATKMIAHLYPVFFATLIYAIYKQFSKISLITISIIFLSLSIILFHILMLLKGVSYGWLRFYIYIIPFSFILFSITIENVRKKMLVATLFITLFFISNIYSLKSISDKNYGKEECHVIEAIKGHFDENYSYIKDMEVVDYINKNNLTNKKIIVDDFTGFGIILNSLNPKIFINNSDKEFKNSLENPRQYADYILVRRPTGIGIIDAINKKYPDMFTKGASYLRLKKDFGIWRLYEIIK